MAAKKKGSKPKKTEKRGDKELFQLIESKISSGDYLFKKHAKQRQKDRDISDIEVLDILEGKSKRGRRRNKAKDRYEEGRSDWNYCIEGQNLDAKKMRIVISFEEDLMPIITVIWI